MNEKRLLSDSDFELIKAGYATIRTRIGVMTRCLNPRSTAYKDYGGRGITICDGWRNSEDSFLRDMGPRPKDHSIERVDNEGGYWCGHCEQCIRLMRPANCRWETINFQMNNRRSSKFIEFEGRRMTVSQWALETGKTRHFIHNRLQHGWSAEAIFTTPKGRHFKRKPNLGVPRSKIGILSKQSGIPYIVIYNRLKDGESPQEAISRPHNAKNKKYTFNGESLTLREWEKRTGIRYVTLWARIKRGCEGKSIFKEVNL